MECNEARRRMGASLDGQDPRAEAVRAHVRGCAACAREEALLVRVRAAMGRAPRTAAPAGLVDRVMARVQGREVALHPWITLLPTIRRMAVAATVLFALSGSYALFASRGGAPESPRTTAALGLQVPKWSVADGDAGSLPLSLLKSRKE
jgi:anti-sigma factor RsiW